MSTPPLPSASRIDLLRWAFRRLRRVRVVGASMEPTLSEGDVVLVNTRAYSHSQPQDLDVVVALHPQQGDIEIVKRVEFVEGHGVYLRSDNADQVDAADSRRFGIVPFEHVLGRVTSKLDRP